MRLNDGAVDVLISCNDEALILLRNDPGHENHWLGLKLIGKKDNIDAVGAVIRYQAGDLKRGRMKVGGGSYLSSHDPRIVLGIGKRMKFDWVEIKWPRPVELPSASPTYLSIDTFWSPKVRRSGSRSGRLPEPFSRLILEKISPFLSAFSAVFSLRPSRTAEIEEKIRGERTGKRTPRSSKMPS